jgi:hypothetical protein
MVACSGNTKTGCLVPELLPPDQEPWYPHKMWEQARGKRTAEAMTAIEFKLERLNHGHVSENGELVLQGHMTTLRWWLSAAAQKSALTDEDILCGFSLVLSILLQLALAKGCLQKMKEAGDKQILRKTLDVDALLRILAKKHTTNQPLQPALTSTTNATTSNTPSTKYQFRSYFSRSKGGGKRRR